MSQLLPTDKSKETRKTLRRFFHFALWLGSRASHTSMQRSAVFSQECHFQWQGSVGNNWQTSNSWKSNKSRDKCHRNRDTLFPWYLWVQPCSWTECYGRWAGRGGFAGGSTPSAGWDCHWKTAVLWKSKGSSVWKEVARIFFKLTEMQEKEFNISKSAEKLNQQYKSVVYKQFHCPSYSGITSSLSHKQKT